MIVRRLDPVEVLVEAQPAEVIRVPSPTPVVVVSQEPGEVTVRRVVSK